MLGPRGRETIVWKSGMTGKTLRLNADEEEALHHLSTLRASVNAGSPDSFQSVTLWEGPVLLAAGLAASSFIVAAPRSMPPPDRNFPLPRHVAGSGYLGRWNQENHISLSSPWAFQPTTLRPAMGSRRLEASSAPETQRATSATSSAGAPLATHGACSLCGDWDADQRKMAGHIRQCQRRAARSRAPRRRRSRVLSSE